jgi:mannosyltransferase OCH1-like enzyme
MGYSDPENKPWAQSKIIELNPKTILDVGAGQGVYLDLIRAVLPEDVSVHAVEVWEPYINQFNLINRYDKLFKMDVREMESFEYDLVILGDILEHMSEEDAVNLWNKISKDAKYAIISIPIIHYHQDAINGNPYEVHVEEDWNTERVLKVFKGIKEHKEFKVTGTFIAKFENEFIPKTIWQTYKDPYNNLQQYMIDASNSWKVHNPEYEYKYMDDQQAKEFVLNEYGQEWSDIFNNLPVGVMRGDLWRYMIIYKYGGVYSDLDTICNEPISNWMPNKYSMIVCPENDRDFCQWTFAASAGHPFLKSVLDHIKEKLKNPSYGSPHFVHTHTGPIVWSHGILSALQIKDKINLIDEYQKINNCEIAKLNRFYLYGGERWRIFHFQSVKHIYGSQKWNDGSYVQWVEDPLVRGTR